MQLGSSLRNIYKSPKSSTVVLAQTVAYITLRGGETEEVGEGMRKLNMDLLHGRADRLLNDMTSKAEL